MRYLVGFVLFLLALGTLRLVGCDSYWFDECYLDRDCDDGNPCTNDVCEWSDTYVHNPDAGWCQEENQYERWCEYDDAEYNGTPCEVDGRPGVCGSGTCRIVGGAPDGGV